MTTRIIFNGREYKSPDDMPPDVRRLYDQALQQLADADRDGIPDIVEQGPEAGNVIGIQHSSFNVNGRNYASVDEMPWVVRRLFEKAMENVDANRDGIPDALQPGMSGSEAHGKDSSSAGLAVETGTRPAMLLLLLVGALVLIYWLL